MATPSTILKKGAAVNHAVMNNKIVESTVSFRRKFLSDKGDIEHGVFEANAITLDVRPYRKFENLCPICLERCRVYDRIGKTKCWRAQDLGNVICYIKGPAHRILCPKHGRRTVYVPWADMNTSFTHEFDMLVTWLCMRLSKADVAELLLIDWDTVGNCVNRVLKSLEVDPKIRLNNLIHIGVDETSYRKGHLYMTIVVDQDTNQVVWASEGVGKDTFMKFFQDMTPEQRASIQTISGDGAKWINECLKEFGMEEQVTRCIDSFHVVQWITDALDNLRRDQWNEAKADLKQLEKDLKSLKTSSDNGLLSDVINDLVCKVESAKRSWKSFIAEIKLVEESIKQLKDEIKTAKDNDDIINLKASLDEHKATKKDLGNYRDSARQRYIDLKKQLQECMNKQAELLEQYQKENGLSLSDAEANIKKLKGCKYVLLKNPEHLTKNQEEAVSLIQGSYPELYQCYHLKEQIRMALHTKDPELANGLIKEWVEAAKASGIQCFVDLGIKIDKWKDSILNTIRLGMSNARIESMNNKIKLVIRRAYGFSNTDNMIAMVMLVCSNLPVNLPNRPPSDRKKIAAKEAALRKARKALNQNVA